MTFSLQTLLALLASVAIAIACVRNAEVGIILMVFVIPAFMLGIALTSPQKGNQLDPSKRWYLLVVVKAWAFALGELVLLMLVFAAAPSVHHRLHRSLNGDSRQYQIIIYFPGDRQTSEQLERKVSKVYDSKGLVGEVQAVNCNELASQSGKIMESRIWILVSTDRDDALGRHRVMSKVDIRPDGSLFLRD